MSDDAGERAIRQAMEAACLEPSIGQELTIKAITAGLCALRRVLREDIRGLRDELRAEREALDPDGWPPAWYQWADEVMKIPRGSASRIDMHQAFEAGWLAAVAKVRGDG